jgi:Cys-tRNA(Pro)/Cys-tRNA(Cys) deacylase
MSKSKEIKTNAMRILETNKIEYEILKYDCVEFSNGLDAAKVLDLDPNIVFKTIVLSSKSKQIYVFVIPVNKEIDLKKAAYSVNEKSVEPIHVKDLFNITGYIRGGCTAIGMKKNYPVIADACIQKYSFIYVSAGKIGFQLKLNSKDYINITKAKLASIVAI